ncbi:MAG TPA: LCP family protein [Candidatus Nanoarchaeia archaeon]
MRHVDLGFQQATILEKQRKRRKKIIFLAVGLLVAVIVGVAGYAFYWPLSALIGQLIKNPGIALSFFRDPNGQLKSTDGKTNLLILGIDKRSNVPYTFVGPSGKQERNGFLSDTIIVASIDLDTKKISLISIPRDTWVSIPAWNNFPASEGKINSAYSLGDTYSYTGGGLKLAEKVVSKHIGLPIHYGVRIDFEGFKKTVDTLGGIDVVVEKTFDDYKYPIDGLESTNCLGGGYNCRFEHIHFDAGPTHMGGATALRYARSRSGTNGEGSDFARARRQQKVIQATLKKAFSIKNLLDPIKVNRFFGDFGETVETDFGIASVPALAKLAKEIDYKTMRTFVLDPSSGLMYSPSPNLYGGAYVIVPKDSWGQVRTKIKEFLNPVSAKEK